MKAEHRKELETNTLAQQLNKAYEGLKHGPSRSTVVWVVAVVGIVLIVVLFRYFWVSSREADSKRWTTLDHIIFPEQLNSVIEAGELANTDQGRLVRFLEARHNLSQGLQTLGSNKEAAQKRLEEARKVYSELARQSGRVPLLHQEALWGAAKANEALGDYKEAENLFEKLAKDYPVSALGKDAEKQVKRLNSDDNRKDLSELKKLYGEGG